MLCRSTTFDMPSNYTVPMVKVSISGILVCTYIYVSILRHYNARFNIFIFFLTEIEPVTSLNLFYYNKRPNLSPKSRSRPKVAVEFDKYIIHYPRILNVCRQPYTRLNFNLECTMK